MKQKHYLDFSRVKTKHYSYYLDEKKIAKYPVKERDRSKLLVYEQGNIKQMPFYELPSVLGAEDFMVFNETKVIKARLLFKKPTGAKIEIFCLEPHQPADYEQAFTAGTGCIWKCTVGNLKKWKQGTVISHIKKEHKSVEIAAEILSRENEAVLIKFHWTDQAVRFGDILEFAGKTPIPPYLRRDSELSDTENYQTVYSRIMGSVAAPTAGLHFTPKVLKDLKTNQTELAFVNLHVGAGTFKPVNSDTADGHNMHSEQFSVTLENLEKIRQHSERITAVGTTSVRSLESLYQLGVKILTEKPNSPLFLSQRDALHLPQNIPVKEAIDALIHHTKESGKNEFQANTQIFIVPGYDFKLVKKMISNFHLPQSTLIMLIAAFIGDDWKKVYQYALNNEFRFLSYGDSSLLIPKR